VLAQLMKINGEKTMFEQKRKLRKMKVEISNLMQVGDKTDDKQIYQAFLLNDQSVNKLIKNVYFKDDDVFMLGKIPLDKRLKPFDIFFTKSKDIQRKFVEILTSFDPLFSDEAKMTKIFLTEPTKGKGHKFEVNFESGYDKAIYFKFSLVENEKDVKENTTLKRYLSVFFNFGAENFTVEVMR
jgi:hypothetical protein